MKNYKEINIRDYAANYIEDPSSRILELGPLNRSLLDKNLYKNYYFADIRNTEEIKAFYSSNEYLENTGIKVDIDSIIDIDFIIKGSYKETFKNIEKFDYIIVSHVLEHIPNLLNFFIDIQNILKKDGELIIIYPDKRYSFDYFRNNSKFSDIYAIYKGSSENLASQVTDFYLNVLSENNPLDFWRSSEKIKFPEKKRDFIKKVFEETLGGSFNDDVHYWPFSDAAFIKFLYDCRTFDLFEFNIKEFIPTQKDTQAFLVILDFSNNKNIQEIDKYYQAKEYAFNHSYKVEEFNKEIRDLKTSIKNYKQVNSLLRNSTNLKIASLKEENHNLKTDKDLLRKKLTKIKNSNSWKITKPLRILSKTFKFNQKDNE